MKNTFLFAALLAATATQAQTIKSWDDTMKPYKEGKEYEATLLNVEYSQREMNVKGKATQTLTTAWAIIKTDTVPVFVDARIANHLQKGQSVYLTKHVISDATDYEGVPALLITGIKTRGKFGDE